MIMKKRHNISQKFTKLLEILWQTEFHKQFENDLLSIFSTVRISLLVTIMLMNISSIMVSRYLRGSEELPESYYSLKQTDALLMDPVNLNYTNYKLMILLADLKNFEKNHQLSAIAQRKMYGQ